MIKIGLISDTHNYLDPQIKDYFADRDEIWHAGDFGELSVVQELEKIAPVTGVYGNIDGPDIRSKYPLHQRFEKGGVDVWMTHIGEFPAATAFQFGKKSKITHQIYLFAAILTS